MYRVSKKVRESGEPTRREVYRIIDEFWRKNYYSPSVRDICKVINKSQCTVKNAIGGLRLQNMVVESSGGKSRMLMPTYIREALIEIIAEKTYKE